MATSKRQEKTPGAELTTVDDGKSFRKTNEAIGLRIKEGRYSLLTRKIFNVMMYWAQEQRVPGLNAPIKTNTSDKYFWIPVASLARDTAYNSRDIELLKKQAEELMNIKVVMENERQWTSERLVSSVTFVNPRGFSAHGGQLWLGFAFPPEVHDLVMAPGTYTRLSIMYQGMLRSGAALSLYEVCRRYATNPSHLTMIQTVEHWYGVLTGNPVGSGDMPEYKYLKRDVVTPAIAEINSLTDIKVELVEHKKGRRVAELQFRVVPSQQGALELPHAPIIDTELVDKLVALDLTLADAQEIVGRYTIEEVSGALDFLLKRMGQKSAAPVSSPAAYFKWALRSGKLGEPMGEPPEDAIPKEPSAESSKDAKPAKGSSLMEKFLAARSKEALGVYKEMPEDAQKTLFEQFKAQASETERMAAAKGPEGTMVRVMLGRWLAKDMWGDPSAEALALFVETGQIGQV